MDGYILRRGRGRKENQARGWVGKGGRGGQRTRELPMVLWWSLVTSVLDPVHRLITQRNKAVSLRFGMCGQDT